VKNKLDNKIKKSLLLIDKIQKIRSNNNRNWMDLLRLSIKLDYKSTSKILNDIVKDDQRISKIAKKISTLK
jgi:hypothetical protein